MNSGIYINTLDALTDDIAFLRLAEERAEGLGLRRYPCYIWGCGRDGKLAYDLFHQINVDVLGFIASAPDQEFFCNQRVYSSQEICFLEGHYNIIVATSAYEDEVGLSVRQILETKKAGLYSFSEIAGIFVREYMYLAAPDVDKINIDSETNLYFYGDYPSWEDASRNDENAVAGYDTDEIFESVAGAVEKVLSGEAAYERDGHAFYKQEYCFPLFSSVLYALLDLGSLNVLDYGGSLGSTWFQHRKVLPKDKIVWNIIEQKHFVDYGKEKIKEINFYDSIDEIPDKEKINLVILSSVLQYFDDPFRYLDMILALRTPYVLVDRTPFLRENTKLVRQNVPSQIYKAVYPAWLIKKSDLNQYMMDHGYISLLEWTTEDVIEYRGGLEQPVFTGIMFQRIDAEA